MSRADDITCKAAVCWGAGECLVIEDVVVGAPKKGEVINWWLFVVDISITVRGISVLQCVR